MATIDIKASTVTIAEKRAAEICGMLAEIGVQFEFTPTINPNPANVVLLKDINMSVRAKRVMEDACRMVNLNFNDTTTTLFTMSISRNDLKKVRNCGKRALEEIENILYRNGLSLA